MKKKLSVILVAVIIMPLLFFTGVQYAFADTTPTYTPDPNQLTKLQDWFKAMDPNENGYVDLFDNDLSYLMLDQNSKSESYSTWPQFEVLSSVYSWNINSKVNENYDIFAVVNSQANAILRVNVGANKLDFTVPYDGFDRYEMGSIAIPKGISTLTLSLNGNNVNSSNVKVIQLELIPKSARPAYDAEIAATRARPDWMKDNPIGAYIQWGEWSQNADGSHTTWPGCYQNMDMSAFVNKLADTGINYLVWSVNWTSFYVGAPIKSIDDIMPGRTTTNFGGHDYLMDLLDLCAAKNIKVIFYFHSGWDHPEWWGPMYTIDLPNNDQYRKDNFYDRWLNIVGEMSNRYGQKLDGWMFDWTNSYNVGPYKMMCDTARIGNPDRMITFNASMNLPYSYTPLTDFFMGEDYTGNAGGNNPFGNMPINVVDGRFDAGPFQGQQVHYCFTTETEGSWWGWGIDRYYGYNGLPQPTLTQTQYNKLVARAINNKIALSFCFQLFESGQFCCDESLARLKKAIQLEKGSPVDVSIYSAGKYDDCDATYTGDWNQQTNASAYDGTITSTIASGSVGSTASVAFNGTGIDLIATKGPWMGTVDIYIDDVLQGNYDCFQSNWELQSTLFSIKDLPSGTHTLKVIKTADNTARYAGSSLPSGESPYFHVDAFEIFNDTSGSNPGITNPNAFSAGMYDDRDATYAGDWNQQTNASAYDGTITSTIASGSVGSTASVTFNGTGIDLIATKGPWMGTVDVFIDDVLQGNYDCFQSNWELQSTLFSVKDLPYGTHTLKVIKTVDDITRYAGSGLPSGESPYFHVDAFEIVNDTSGSNPGITNPNAFSTGMYDDRVASYTGNWSAGTHPSAYNGTITSTIASGSVGSTASVAFNGTGIDLIVTKGPWMGSVDVYIDDVLQGNNDCFQNDWTFQSVLFSKKDLSMGTHTLKIVKTNDNMARYAGSGLPSGESPYFHMDAFKVY